MKNLNLGLLIQTSRPVSWVNTAYPFGAAYIVLTGSVDAFLGVMTLFFLVPYNYLMYGVNDIFDYESDINNPRKNSIEGAILPKKLHKFVGYSSVLIALPFIIFALLNNSFVAGMVLLFAVFLVAAYSVPPFRFKEIPFIDSFTSACHFTLPFVYALVVTSASVDGLLIAVALLLWSMASHAFGAVQDIIPDRKANIASIATKHGASFTVKFATVLYLGALTAILISSVGVMYSLIPLLYLVNIVRFIDVDDINAHKANQAWKNFIYLNLLVGFLVTVSLMITQLDQG